MSWREMATDNYRAANALLAAGYWRSCISRAYYAVFARCIDELMAAGVSLPARGNPSHQSLRTMLLNNLRRFSPVRRQLIGALVLKLYRLRIVADYGAAIVVGHGEARQALGLMFSVFRELR